MNIKIEKLQSTDLESYKALIDESFDSSNDLDVYTNSYKENSESYRIIVAKTDDNKIVGTLTFYKLDLFTFGFQPTLEIFNVCVSGQHRGKKIAKKLFDYTLKFAIENNYKSINLTCLDTATDAHRLYESMGMEKTNSIKYFLSL